MKGFSLSLSFHLHTRKGSPFDPHRSNQVTYRLLTNDKAAPYDILYIIVSKDIGLFVQEIALRWIFMKICIRIDFEVLNNV